MKALFIGAHPDDIEIGCGGTLLRLLAEGNEVSALILTQERDGELRNQRRLELEQSLSGAGVKPENIHLWTADDGALRADREAVAAFRELLSSRGIVPDLVFCHTSADSHGDHRQANELCRAAFRGVTILLYSVVNSGVVNDFRPDLWVDISHYVAQKERMLRAYKSQIARGRILWEALRTSHSRQASRVHGEAAEAFQTLIQEGDSDGAELLSTLNDCVFTKIWRQLINFDGEAGGVLTIIYGRSVGGVLTERDGDSFNRDVASVCEIQKLLLRHFAEAGKFNGLALRSEEASAYSDDKHFRMGDVLVVGGPAVNNAALRFVDHMSGIRYRIAYDIPDYADLRIIDNLTGEQIRAEYDEHRNGTRTVLKDYAIINILKNPYCKGRLIIGAMGIHGYGTQAAVKLLSGRSNGYSELLGAICSLAVPEVFGIQLLLETFDEKVTRIRSGSLYKIIANCTNREADPAGARRVVG
ncbi:MULTISPECIES: PIG-L deacetylase family protein [unclassified Bradyrhizobium]|uniref:PIG-L deacetylase family protein n=1 Tax=unclassified Bradyrhizobium TaxID=2631580 RepID=UPI002915E234|nr:MULTISPECIES: PIG-L deacetylase family protein [unclassified Bradyrhizobium]